MTAGPTTAARSAVMRAVKGRDTGPERALRRLLTAAGHRYRLQDYRWRGAVLPGRPDLVMPRRRLAVFVHGCWWHGHDCPRGARPPKANAEYWLAKVARNRARDAASELALQALGWRPLVVWECELRAPDPLWRRLKPVLAPAVADAQARA